MSVVLKISKPAGVLTPIASRCAVVRRGNSSPFVVLSISSAAAEFGLVVAIPTEPDVLMVPDVLTFVTLPLPS